MNYEVTHKFWSNGKEELFDAPKKYKTLSGAQKAVKNGLIKYGFSTHRFIIYNLNNMQKELDTERDI